jgi:nucleotide-binding universal stress UspA family protein
MSWRDILVFADGSENGLARARMAADLSVATGAALEVCVVACLPPLSASGGAEFAVEAYDEIERGAREDATRAVLEIRSRFPELAGRLLVDMPEARLPDVPELAGSLGQTADLVVIGQPIAEDATRLDDALLDGSLFRTGRPCLMFPRWNEPQVWGKRVVIAWKNVREAARAVHDALPLLKRAEEVCAITIEHGPHADRSLARSMERLTGHLARLGVRTESQTVVTDKADGPAILKQVESWRADLLVMGGYGHSTFRERVFGGATRTAIRESPVPVLLSH